jgi:hypothetical protein
MIQNFTDRTSKGIRSILRLATKLRIIKKERKPTKNPKYNIQMQRPIDINIIPK